MAVSQSTHVPHPLLGQISAAAKEVAAMDRPEPGGQVKSQEWVISWLSMLLWDAFTAS